MGGSSQTEDDPQLHGQAKHGCTEAAECSRSRLEYNRRTMPGPFEILEHPADVGFVAYGRTLEELFENAALAMLSLACEREGIEERTSRFVQATGSDNEALLYAWLAEILAAADAEQLVFRRADVTAVSSGRACGRR